VLNSTALTDAAASNPYPTNRNWLAQRLGSGTALCGNGVARMTTRGSGCALGRNNSTSDGGGLVNRPVNCCPWSS
jgi:hypothetical protein